MKLYFKIVKQENGQLKTVHFALNKSRKIPWDKWIKAEKKIITDGGGGTKYISGIHVLATKEDAENYMRHFRKDRELLKIVPCYAMGVRIKKHSREKVYLANRILIPNFEEIFKTLK